MAGMTRAEALANPAEANAQLEALLGDDNEKPVLEPPPSDLIELPGGLVYHGEVYRSVRVRELDGHAEEALIRALQPAPGTFDINWANFITVLLECGTVQFADLDQRLTRELLKDVLIGDRDALVLGIRQATYGDTVDLKGWQCPACGGITDLGISLAKDVETTEMADPKASTIEIPLRNGRKATARLATGRDLTAMYDQSKLNRAERESIMLTRCLLKVTEADGRETKVQGRATGIVMGLSIPDRRALVRELEKHQPGPRYNGIKFVHQDCQKEVPLALGLGELFPDIF